MEVPSASLRPVPHPHQTSQTQLCYQDGTVKSCEWQNEEYNPVRLAVVFIMHQEAHNPQCMFDNLYFLSPSCLLGSNRSQ